jgi:hypothetical protein
MPAGVGHRWHLVGSGKCAKCGRTNFFFHRITKDTFDRLLVESKPLVIMPDAAVVNDNEAATA